MYNYPVIHAAPSEGDGLSKLLLVRHGRTAWHAEGRYAGTADVPLDDVGRQQVARVVERLSSVEFAAIYTSTMFR